jgi:hypothetical protein
MGLTERLVRGLVRSLDQRGFVRAGPRGALFRLPGFAFARFRADDRGFFDRSHRVLDIALGHVRVPDG